jgi:hypothetical protein
VPADPPPDTPQGDPLLRRADVRHLLDALHDPRQAVAIAALRALAQLPLDSEVGQDVARFLAQPVRWIAGDGAWPSYYDRAEWQPALIEAAVHVADDVLRRQLYTILKDATPDVRRATAHALARAGDAAALSHLVADLAANDPEDRRRAARSLTWLNVTPVRHHLRQLCAEHSDGRVRLWLALALARLGDPSGLEALLDAVAAGGVAVEVPEDTLPLVEQVAARGPFPRPIHDFVRAVAADAGTDARARDLARTLLDALDLARDGAYGAEPRKDAAHRRGAQSVPPAAEGRSAEPDAEAGPTEGEPRWLQAQLLDSQGEPSRRALQAGARHRLLARIGPRDAAWIAPPRDAAFPAEELPPEEDEYGLRVVFWEPTHVPQPLVASIYLLRRGGSSTTCEFQFRTRPESGEFAGRIVVAHGNRILQTMVLRGRVVADPGVTGPAERITLAPEMFVRANLADLEGRPPIDISLLADTAADGVTRLAELAGPRAALRSLENLDLPLGRLRRRLARVANTPEAFPLELDADATVDLLRFLARQGRLLYNAIVETQISTHPIRHAQRIQLVSARESFLPLEFVYEGPSPAPEATLCPNAAVALEVGQCVRCDYAAARDIICPLRFWCLSRVIERHAVQPLPESGLAGADYALQADPVAGRDALSPPYSAASAASHHVREAQLADLLQTLARITQEPAEYVEDWDAWRSVIRRRGPPLLVLLPHTLEDKDYIPTLEIGAGERLPEDQITPECVHATHDRPPPVVLLLGCETAVPDIPFQAFAAQFRLNGAAIVLSTLTPVLGRHAVPVAQILLEELHRTAQAGGVFGEAMLRVRRRALSAGIPMVLSLVAYGDADWRLEPGGVGASSQPPADAAAARATPTRR